MQRGLVIMMSVIANCCLLRYKICILNRTKQYKYKLISLDILIHLSYPSSIVIMRVYCKLSIRISFQYQSLSVIHWQILHMYTVYINSPDLVVLFSYRTGQTYTSSLLSTTALPSVHHGTSMLRLYLFLVGWQQKGLSTRHLYNSISSMLGGQKWWNCF
jgi:hypothetical protein